jgi:lysozyme
MTTAKDLIKQFEGCKLSAYQDVIGVWTIGYGHTGNVQPGQNITQAEADQLLMKDLGRTIAEVDAMVKVPLNQNQMAALYDFAFNLGVNALRNSTMLKLINTGQEASGEFVKWNHAGGKVVDGLTRRRLAERALWLTSMSM